MIYEEFVTFVENRNGQLYASCPFHPDKTPSFTVNEETGEWYCHSCKRGGKEPEFVSAIFDVDKQVARHAINMFVARHQWPFPTREYIKGAQQALRNSKLELHALYDFGMTDEVIDKYELGLDGERITIPVYSKTGYCINVRKYLPPHHRTSDNANNAKCINIRNLGEKRYYPVSAFDQDTIYIVEGEKDCLVAISQGFNAVTSTGGSAIPTDEIMLFRNKEVYIMLDTDLVGKKNTKTYCQLLRTVAKSINIVDLPNGSKDFTEYWQQYHNKDVSNFTRVFTGSFESDVTDTVEMSLVRSESVENLNTWVTLPNMSVTGTEQKVYSVPRKLKVSCRNVKCNKTCPLALGVANPELTEIDVEPRYVVSFLDAPDSAQETLLKKMFGCKHVMAEPMELVNAQRLFFQETAAFTDGLEDAATELRQGIFMYSDKRLQPTMRYDFEACRVTDPRSQNAQYLIRSATTTTPGIAVFDDTVHSHFREIAKECNSAKELLQKHYDEWLAYLGIEGRLDLFGSILLTYASVTEIPWNMGYVKGWLDIMCVGDTRTGKSQMAQRMCKFLGMGNYINGENAKSTGVIGGVQKLGHGWVITWGAIPMNDKGLLFIDEASGLTVDDIKELSATRSSGAVQITKVIKGEARARTRLIWMSNPRSGKNVAEYYWKGFSVFQEYIPSVEDQARYDLVLTAAREDVSELSDIESIAIPDVELYRNLFNFAWSVTSDNINVTKDVKQHVKQVAKKISSEYEGGPLIISVSVHEKLLRLGCAFAILCGDTYDGIVQLTEKHIDYAYEWLVYCLNKETLCYTQYIVEKRQAEERRKDNLRWIAAQLELHPAFRALLTANSFKGFQIIEVLGIDRTDASKLLSELLSRGLVKASSGGVYVPDKLLLDAARPQMVFD